MNKDKVKAQLDPEIKEKMKKLKSEAQRIK